MNASEFSKLLIQEVNEFYWKVTFASKTHFYEMKTVAELRAFTELLHETSQVRVVVFEVSNLELYPKDNDTTDVEVGSTSTVIEAGVFSAWNRIIRQLSEVPVILISVIRGVVRGRIGDFIMACDIRYASREKASFGHPEISWGVIPRVDVVEQLVRSVGPSRTIEILAGCDDYDADLAEKYGWVNRTFPDWQLDNFVEKYVNRVGSYEKHVLSGLKQRVKDVVSPDIEKESQRSVVWYEDTSIPSENIFAPFWLKSTAPVSAHGHKFKLNRPTIGIRCDSELRVGHFIGELWDS